jgi:GTP-binding protein HflX
VLFSDTVGFIQKLPTTLIAAFRATLEEITEADLLVHVVDSSHVNVNEQIESVEDTLAELDMPDVPRILVMNKTDAVDELPPIDADENYFAEVSISARRKHGLDTLLAAVDRALALQMRLVKLLVPYDRGDLLSELYERTKVTAREDTSEGVRITAQIPLDVYDHFKTYER